MRSRTTLLMGMNSVNRAMAPPAIQPTPALISSETPLATEGWNPAADSSAAGCWGTRSNSGGNGHPPDRWSHARLGGSPSSSGTSESRQPVVTWPGLTAGAIGGGERRVSGGVSRALDTTDLALLQALRREKVSAQEHRRCPGSGNSHARWAMLQPNHPSTLATVDQSAGRRSADPQVGFP